VSAVSSTAVEAFFDELDRAPHPDTSLATRRRRLNRLFTELGHPERGLDGVHLVGTNGKGSVGAMLEAVGQEAGLSTGLFTSPHLVDITERFRINGSAISFGELEFWIETIRPALRRTEATVGTKPTYFETLLALAVIIFRAHDVQLPIFEAGMGGRRSATAVLPLNIQVITNVAVDHMSRLGRTISDVAMEKSGMLRPGQTVITSAEREALSVIQTMAKSHGVRCVSSHVPTNAINVSWQGTTVRLPDGRSFSTNLIGTHQGQNAGLVLHVIDELQRRGWSISPSAVSKGLRQVNWSGRFTVIDQQPRIVVDGGYKNNHSMAALQQTITQLAIDPKHLAIIMAVHRGEHMGRQFDRLVASAEHLLLLEQATPINRQTWLARWPQARFASSWVEALAEADRLVGTAGTVLITGPLPFVGQVLAGLKQTQYDGARRIESLIETAFSYAHRP